MSFFDIKDSVERDRIVQDYKKLKQEIRESNENKKRAATELALNLEKRYAPIVRSQKLMSDDIVKELRMQNQDMPEQVKTENEEYDIVKPSKLKLELDTGHLAEEYRRRFSIQDKDIDTEFGINFHENGDAYIGHTPITIQGDDIVIKGKVYHGTKGLWELLGEKREENFTHEYKEYDEEDRRNYMDILDDTDVLRHNFDPDSTRPRSSASWKWTNILSDLWQKIKKKDEHSSEEEEEEEEEEERPNNSWGLRDER